MVSDSARSLKILKIQGGGAPNRPPLNTPLSSLLLTIFLYTYEWTELFSPLFFHLLLFFLSFFWNYGGGGQFPLKIWIGPWFLSTIMSYNGIFDRPLKLFPAAARDRERQWLPVRVIWGTSYSCPSVQRFWFLLILIFGPKVRIDLTNSVREVKNHSFLLYYCIFIYVHCTLYFVYK